MCACSRDRQRQNGHPYDFSLLRSLRVFNDFLSILNAGIFGLIRVCPHYLSLKLTWDLDHRLKEIKHQAIEQCLVFRFPQLTNHLMKSKCVLTLDSDKSAGKLAKWHLLSCFIRSMVSWCERICRWTVNKVWILFFCDVIGMISSKSEQIWVAQTGLAV